jgi:DNA (cytosine-5)-methyltransferase 1
MRFGSVCSGIEAASVAWHPLGWQAAWVSEIEPFPSAVLAHHWPNVPNLGDMLRLPARVAAGEIEAPDILVGGTPCQAFSVAGKRGSLEDERGALTLAYVELANEIDKQRQTDGNAPCIIVWENVPGVLNTKDNAFGCFLAALAGESEPLEPAGGRWTNAGAVFGPQRTIAWRVLDAQYFGVAQRRRRVFVVASARDGFDPCEVLFEREGVRRDSAPSREAGKNLAADAGTGAGRGSHWDALTNPHPSLNQSHNTGGIGASNQELFSQRGSGIVPQTGYRMVAFGEYADDNTASAMKARDYKDATDLAVCATGDIAHTLKAEGFDGSEDGTGRGVPTIAFQPGNPRRGAGSAPSEDVFPTLKSDHGRGMSDQFPHVATAQTVALRGRDGGATAELGGDVATALRASTGGGDKPHVLVAHGTQDPCVGVDVAFAQGRNNGGENAVLVSSANAFAQNTRDEVRLLGGDGEICGALAAQPGMKQTTYVAPTMAVRRLTPRECERLQGFPDDYTLVPHRNKPAADGPRYKSLGNSMAVPVMRWIGERIQHVEGI